MCTGETAGKEWISWSDMVRRRGRVEQSWGIVVCGEVDHKRRRVKVGSSLLLHPLHHLLLLEGQRGGLSCAICMCSTCTYMYKYMYIHVHEERLGNIFRELRKTSSHLGLNRGPLTLAVSALPPELWPQGDSQPSQFSISLCMCRQNPARDRPVTPLHQGRSRIE